MNNVSKSPRILYFDIETSLMTVYTHYIGNKVSISYKQIAKPSSIICIAYKWAGDKKVSLLTWDKRKDDRKMLEEFNKIASKADFICGHNAQGFDVKEIRGAIALRGLATAWCETPVIDTLTDCRRAFRFKSNRLDAIARSLGLSRKDPMGMEDWIDLELPVTNRKYKQALNKMTSYNKQDVIVLEDVHKRLDKYTIPTNSRVNLAKQNHGVKCSDCSSLDTIKYGRYTYNKQAYQKYLCKTCSKVLMPERQ